MSAHQQDKPKKSFEFRMSKKVAELTQVVHMLFTRNHEKEVEIDALKKAYENEIDLVMKDAKEKITNLERTIEDLHRKSNLETEKIRKNQIGEIANKECEWRQKMAEAERQLHEERTECQNLRDLLINAQSDIEKLRQGVTDEVHSKSDELRKKDMEVERLRAHLSSTEAELKSSQKDAQSVMVDLEKSNERLDDELRQLRTSMENSHKTRDQLLTRNKQLEHDMKSLKREFNKKATEIANSQLKNVRNNLSLEANQELERLRREVQRYRMELSNRDNNFNRMFSDKQPVLLNQRQSSMSKSNPNALYTTFSTNQSQSAGGQALRNGIPNPNAISQNPTGSGLLQDRPPVTNGFSNSARKLDRQKTLPDRDAPPERVLSNVNGTAPENRPQTQGPSFSYDRQYSALKRQLSPVVQDEPSQIVPQRYGSVVVERPNTTNSSSLPSICSTPERRHSRQLAKPKPLPREMLYSK